ncbi:MAG TPA: hydantoinase B/oxoprolinase family protein [Chloroflexota bacterium]|nr:hydantoinase B/oxoprolinase family protein [Chloroflexota bacterium]
MGLDPITLEVINNRLREIVATMEHLLFHSGYSTILRESFDGSAGLCDREGHTVMASGAPYHLFPYYYSVRGVLRNYALEDMHEGDSFILTDPYWGGNLHVPDLVIVTPVFVDGQVIGFCVSIAHKTDLGGLVPGSSGAGAREIFHDGLLLPGVRYWTRDGVVREIEAIVKRNSRSPDTVAGDIRAQVGCTRVGAQRIRDLCAEYGTENILFAFAELQRLSEQRVRQGLAAWPDGEAEAEGWSDHDGVDLDRPIRLHVKVTKRGDEITFDYSQMHEQVKGPTNLRQTHAETAALLALLAYLDPTIPINDGARRPIHFINPEGRITNARWPAPVNSYFGLTVVVYSTVMKALAQFNPQRAVGTVGFGIGAIAVGYRQGSRQPIQYEILSTSLGGTPEHDGTFPVMAMSHVTPNTPVEILETEYPVRVVRHEWIPDTAGAGRYRGGPGVRKEYEFLADALFTLRMGHQFNYSGWGVLGGKAPPTARAFLNRGTDRERALGPLETLELRPGDRVCIELPGGGGYGDPYEREPERVLEDVLNGYVSLEAARRDYGVVIDPQNFAIDREATARLRERRATAP